MRYLKILLSLLKNIGHPTISCWALIDDCSRVDKKAKINRFAKLSNSTIGKYSYVGPHSRIIRSDIGSFCSISWGCQIGLISHSLHFISTSPLFLEVENGTGSSWIDKDVVLDQGRRTQIGSDVWLGANSIVLAGVCVGNGSVIGAGSIVTKDVPPYCIVAGNPARVIRKRFDDDVINYLERLEWWTLNDEELKNSIELFQKNKPALDVLKNLSSGPSKNVKVLCERKN